MKPAGISWLTKTLLTVLGLAMSAEMIIEPNLLHKADDLVMLGLVLVFAGWWYTKRAWDDLERRELMLFLGLGIFTKAAGVMMEVWGRITLGDDIVWAVLMTGILMVVVLWCKDPEQLAEEECQETTAGSRG